MYKILIAKKAQKEFLKLDPAMQTAVRRSVKALKYFPQGDIKKLLEVDNIYRLRVRDWRVIFAVDQIEKLIRITHVRKRTERTYKNL